MQATDDRADVLDRTVCRPSVLGVVIWFVLSTTCCVAFAVVLSILGSPVWVKVVFAALGLAAIGTGVAIARSHFIYDEHTIESRYFRCIVRNWNEAIGWSRLRKKGTLFIKFRDGVIIGSDGWALSNDEVDELAAVLQRKLGDPKTGPETIMPVFMKALVGRLFD